MSRSIAFAALIIAGLAAPALAQSTLPNPLRARPAEAAAETPKAKVSEKSETKAEQAPAKPKRERSAKQKEQDEIMRSCGASWRADKTALAAKGTKWRDYLKECRAARKAGGEKA